MINVFTTDSVQNINRAVIRRELSQTHSGDLIFVVPEFAKAQVEREVIACLETVSSYEINAGSTVVTAGFTNGDILSFIKLASRILDCCGVSSCGGEGDTVLRNAIYSVISNRRADLKTLGKLATRFEYINSVISLLGDFSRYGIGPDQLDQAIRYASTKSRSQDYLDKLSDIRLIMTELMKLNEKYGFMFLKDPIAAANETIEGLDDSRLSGRHCRSAVRFFKSHYCFIGFGSTRLLTPQEMRLVSNLSSRGAVIDFYTLCSDASGSETSKLYKCGNEFVSKLSSDYGAKVSRFVPEQESFDTAGDMSAVSEAAMDYALGRPYGGEPSDDIILSEIKGIDDRIGYVFNEIIRLTHRKDGLRYKDIRVVCCDESLTGRLRSNAELYGLDIFIDRKIELGNTVVPFFVQTMIELPLRNYSVTYILKAMRSGVLHIPPYVADNFDNFCKARNIKDAARLFDADAYQEPQGHEHRIWIKEGTVPGVSCGWHNCGEFFAGYVLKDILVPFKEACEKVSKAHTLSLKAEAVMEYLLASKAYVEALRDELMNRGDSANAVALVRGFDELVKLLTGFRHEMNDVDIDQKTFLSLIRIDMRNKTEGTIPLKVDSIEITTPEHAFQTPCRAMFILGANRDNFPYKRRNEGLFSHSELAMLSDSIEGASLPDRNEIMNREEFVSCCLLLGSCGQRLYMCHEFASAPSRVYEFLKTCIDGQRILVNSYTNNAFGEAVTQRHDFKSSSIDPGDMRKLLNFRDGEEVRNGMRVSVSSIEEFNNCHLRFMIRRILKIDEREDRTSVKSNDFGTLMHSMLELSMKKLAEGCMNFDDFKKKTEVMLASEDRFTELMNYSYISAIKEAAVPGSIDGVTEEVSPWFDSQTGTKLRRMYRFMMKGILKDCTDGGYLPSGFEQKIGDVTSELPILMDYQLDSMLFRFTGSIDRYDIKEGEDNKKHIRVEDYKTGNKSLSSSELLNGVQIQLPAYSYALCKGISNSLIDNYGYSQVGLAAPEKGEALVFEPKNCDYSPDDIDTAMRYSDLVIRRSIRRIADGEADALAAPVGHTLCAYCPYAGSCGNVPSKPVRAKGENTDSAAEFVNCNSKALQAEYQSGKSKWNKRNAISFKAMNDALEEGTRG